MIHLHSMTNNSIRAVHSVSDLCAKRRHLLEEKFSNIWVTGEVASISTPVSGHWYLSLKDEKSQLRCVMFKGANIRCKKPKIGDEVLVSGKFSLYEARGDLQLILNHMEPRGIGTLYQEFEQLKTKLLEEGLFATEHKKPIPKYPERIALVTSATGAALEDILTLMRRHKYGGVVKVFPSIVQGVDAPSQLISAIQEADDQACWDLILLSRGGGSYEDLFCFNHEALARAIFALNTPLVSAIGHEVDTTISDYVADLRCATPTAAAEQVLGAHIQLNPLLKNIENRLANALTKELKNKQHQLAELKGKLRDPVYQLQNYQQYLDRLLEKAKNQLNTKIQGSTHRINLYNQALLAQSPQRKIDEAASRLANCQSNLLRAGPENIEKSRSKFVQLCQYLEVVSPMATITRGYSVLQKANGKVIRSIKDVQAEEALRAKLSDGDIYLEVKETHSLKEPN